MYVGALPLLALALSSGPADRAAALDAGLSLRPAGTARAVWASALLLGAPYRPSPLGEASGPDPDPRFRLDAFDCLTFVETAIALGNASSTAEAALLLDDLRYHGPPDYARRNHYVEAQWLPSNLDRGWLEEATRAIAGDSAAVRVEKFLTAASWRSAAKAGRVLRDLPEGERPLGRYSLDVVPLARVPEVAPRIPDGTLLLVVREDRPSRPYRVTHAGIVVVGRGGERYLRHASDVPAVLRVRDERLDRFLARNARYQGWPVTGVALFTIRDNTERAGKLLAANPNPTPNPTSSPHP